LIRLRAAALLALAVSLVIVASGCGNDNPPYNDTPVITSLFPPTAAAGGPGLTLYVAGNGFISTSVVYWNNSARTTTYNTTSTQLSISVTAQDIATPGTAQVVVVTPAPGGGPSTAVNFTITPAQNPVPTLTSISPASTPVGTLPAGNILTVNGTNFVSSSSVAFNGNLRPTNFVSATQLTVPLRASDVASNATITVTVSNPTPGGGVSGSAAFTVGTGSAVRLKASLGLPAGAQFPQVVSVSAAGGPANGASAAPAVSSDGRFVAFSSTATNLMAEGASGSVFVRDTCLGAANCSPQTIAVDLAPDGSPPNAPADSQVAISGDGRYVAFASNATNLVAGASASNAPQWSVYVRDLCVGADAPQGCVTQTQLVSVGVNGSVAVGASYSPSLSSDGRFVAFVSMASNLVAGLSTSDTEVYVRDTCAGSTGNAACVPQTYSASQSINNGSSAQMPADPVISADGRYVAFDASTGSLASAAIPSASRVYLADMCLGQNAPAACAPSTAQISISADGSPLLGVNRLPSISADARFIAFQSLSSSTSSAPDTFLRDTCLGVAEGCVPSTTLLIQDAAAPYVSSNGRFVSFVASASSVSGGATLGIGSLYVYDTCFGAIGTCTPQAYPITATGLGSASPLTVTASPSPLTSDGTILVFATPASIAGLPTSGLGDVLLTAPMY
jgi:hypothetical protein